MKYLVLLLVVATFAIARGSPPLDYSATCGQDASSRIAGGQVVAPHRFPWMAFLGSSLAEICGAVVITQGHALTAAHCGGAPVYVLYLGAVDITLASEPGRIVLMLTQSDFIPHEDYNDITSKNDIALLRFPHPVQLNNVINVPCLQTVDDVQPGDTGVAAGWGFTVDGSTIPSKFLRAVDLSITPDQPCVDYFSPYISNTIICVSTLGGYSICKGDSGGPLMKFNAQTQRWDLVGIASLGPPVGCQLNFPVVFTRVSLYQEWISNHTGRKI